MIFIVRDLLPLSLPSPFLSLLGDCFAGTLALTAAAVVSIRLFWRRGKGMYDL